MLLYSYRFILFITFLELLSFSYLDFKQRDRNLGFIQNILICVVLRRLPKVLRLDRIFIFGCKVESVKETSFFFFLHQGWLREV